MRVQQRIDGMIGSALTMAASRLAGRLTEMRRQLHQDPELGHQEVRTTARVRAWLENTSIVRFPLVSPTGLVGDLIGQSDGPVVALRADLDGLPVEEGNTAAAAAGYRSREAGRMHACGHDFHTAALVGAALLLDDMRDRLHGRVRLIFQPGEEGGTGALAMIREGVLAAPAVDMIFALHSFPGLEAGQVGVSGGPLMAAADAFDITVRGEGGHAGLPHWTRDPIVAAAAIISALQTIVSRKTDPFSTAVVTLGVVQGGTDRNVIPGEVTLAGTIRSFDAGIRARLHQQIDHLVLSVADGYGVQASVSIRPEGGPVVNDDSAAAIVRDAARAVLGAECVVPAEPVMAGEDFAYYLEHVPGCMFWLGTASRDDRFTRRPWHHPAYDTDESALPAAAAVLAETALRALEHLREGSPARAQDPH